MNMKMRCLHVIANSKRTMIPRLVVTLAVPAAVACKAAINRPEATARELRRALTTQVDLDITFGRDLVSEIALALRHLKIYTYSIPQEAYRLRSDWLCVGHLQAERHIPNYFRRSVINTDNPEEADFFLIDHDFSCIINNCVSSKMGILPCYHQVAFGKHLKPVIDRVVMDYPYFNRSQGRDHLFVFLMDAGARCTSFSNKDIMFYFKKLENVTFIMNFGVNKFGSTSDTHELLPPYMKCTHETDRDIVIPQYHPWLPPDESSTERLLKVVRKYDTYFYGAFTNGNIRKHLKVSGSADGLGVDDRFNYVTSLRPLSVFHKEILDSYFGLAPSGMAPWSQRLFDALFRFCVPVILANGIIEPFESFLDWTTFTVKLNTFNLNDTINTHLDGLHQRALDLCGQIASNGSLADNYLARKIRYTVAASTPHLARLLAVSGACGSCWLCRSGAARLQSLT
jgi:hypothetical protein